MSKLMPFIARQINYLKRKEYQNFCIFLWLPMTIPMVLMMHASRRFLLIRLVELRAHSMGSFAVVPEIYLCRRDLKLDASKQRIIDLFYVGPQIANRQLLIMWERVFPRVFKWPYYFFQSIEWVNRQLPGGACHVFYHETSHSKQRDLLDRTASHLQMTTEEEVLGQERLGMMGIPIDAKIVTLLVRDSAYMASFKPDMDDRGNDIRNSDIDNFVLMAEELVERGYYVVRMGAKVAKPMKTDNPRIIDYASSSLRDDFMDIYIASKCVMMVSTGAGFDAVLEYVFRKPTVFVSYASIIDWLGCCIGYSCVLSKIYFDASNGRKLSVREIFTRDMARCHTRGHGGFESQGVYFVENSPEEIRDTVIESIERLTGTWKPSPEDEDLQRQFWSLMPVKEGEMPIRYSAHFLRKNHEWFLK